MTLLAIVVALALEQWRAFEWRASAERAYVAYVRGIEERLNGGTLGQGAVAIALAIVPPVLVAWLAWWIANGIHRQKPAIERLLHANEAAQVAIQHIDHAEVAPAQELADVGFEVDGHALGKRPVPGHADSQALADAAVRSIGRHHVLGANPRRLAALARLKDGGHA